MSLTKSQAHQKFGDLYRRSRSPELQKKVDAIVNNTADIFKRIELIEELDQGSRGSSAGGSGSGNVANRNKPSASRSSGATKSKTANENSIAAAKKAKPAKKNDSESAPGLLQQLFGTKLSRFGKRTNTLSGGLFAQNVKLTENARRIFHQLPENKTVDTLKFFKSAINSGWKVLTAAEYNSIVFFETVVREYLLIYPVILHDVGPDVIFSSCNNFFANYLRFTNDSKNFEVLGQACSKFIRQIEKLKPFEESLNYTLSLFNDFESARFQPNMQDVIQAVYSIKVGDYVEWESILEKTNISPLNEKQFLAPPEVLADINPIVKKMRHDLSSKKRILEETEKLTSYYFNLENGKFDFSFIKEILSAPTAKSIEESVRIPQDAKFHDNPVRLIYFLLSDFRINFFDFLEGVVKITEYETGAQFFAQGIWTQQMNDLIFNLGILRNFINKYPNHAMTFKEYKSFQEHEAQSDPISTSSLEAIQNCLDLVRKMSQSLRVVYENHMLAVEYERNGKIDKDVLSTKKSFIGEIIVRHRFIPYHTEKVLQENRLKGYTVERCFLEMARNFTNILAIYRDHDLLTKLNSSGKIKAEIASLEKDFVRFQYHTVS